MTAPVRIQRQRTKGWRMPENTRYVGRGTDWGNPWVIGLALCGCRSPGECGHNTFRCETPEEAVAEYRRHIEAKLARQDPYGVAFRANLELLRGRNLACWCPLDRRCHADLLLEIANR